MYVIYTCIGHLLNVSPPKLDLHMLNISSTLVTTVRNWVCDIWIHMVVHWKNLVTSLSFTYYTNWIGICIQYLNSNIWLFKDMTHLNFKQLINPIMEFLICNIHIHNCFRYIENFHFFKWDYHNIYCIIILNDCRKLNSNTNGCSHEFGSHVLVSIGCVYGKNWSFSINQTYQIW